MTVSRNHQHSDWEQQFERLSAYLDDEVDEDERAALERHLPTCEECRSALEELRQTRALLRALPVPVAPRSFLIPETGAVPQSITRNTAGTSSARHVRRARVLQWVGGLVAAVGLFILLSSALQAFPYHSSLGASSASSAGQSAASRPLTPPSNTVVVTQRPSSTTSGAGGSPSVAPTATRAAIPPTATGVAVTATGNRAKPPSSTGTGNGTGNPIPLGPITGVLLLIGGAGLLLAGARLTRRL